MELLSGWLLFVGALRLLAVVLGYVDKKYFQQQVFIAQPHELSALGARLFSAWCSITCALCVFLSQNLSNHALFAVTFFSFAVALAFFTMEVVVYRTVNIRGVWMQGFIASTSLILMYLHASDRGVHHYTKLHF